MFLRWVTRFLICWLKSKQCDHILLNLSNFVVTLNFRESYSLAFLWEYRPVLYILWLFYFTYWCNNDFFEKKKSLWQWIIWCSIVLILRIFSFRFIPNKKLKGHLSTINTNHDIQMDNNKLDVGKRKKTLKPNGRNIGHAHYITKNMKTI